MERPEVIVELKENVGGAIQIPAELSDEMPLVEDLNADLLDILMAVEDPFQLKIPDADLTRMRIVGGAVAYLQEKSPL